jgi:beta-lactamase class A
MNTINKILSTVLLVLIIGVIYFQSWGEVNQRKTHSSTNSPIKKYPLISRGALVDKLSDRIIKFMPLRNHLRQVTSAYGDRFGFYFEYLPTGVSLGRNDRLEFNYVSLVKVPLVMAYYDQLEDKKKDTSDVVVTIKPEEIDSRFGTLWKKGSGSRISLEEAIRLALVESDNTAALVIADNISEDNIKNVYNSLDLDMPLPKENGQINISPRTYASILKALYFSSIVNRDHSEKILDLLTKTPFNEYLVAGIPKNITVAHKIGISKGEFYHDCGIVYVPQRPYLICLMTQTTEDNAKEQMKTVSKIVYDYVTTAQYTNP